MVEPMGSEEHEHTLLNDAAVIEAERPFLRDRSEPQLEPARSRSGPHSETGGGAAQAVRRLSAFFVLIVVLIFGLNALINVGLERIRTSSFGSWNKAMQGRVNADVVISGSSRATYHYDPRAIEASTGETAYNIGRVGSQTDVQLAVLKAYLAHNKKPDIVIHNLDAFTFVASREIYDPAQYVPYLSYDELYKPLRSIDPEMMKSRYLPLYGYVVEDMDFTWVSGLEALVGWMPREDYYQGFCPREREWTDEFERFKEGNPQGVKFAVEPAGVKALEELIQLCRERGIRLILVYSPEYAEMQKMTQNRAQIFAEFDALASRYHVPLWDFSNWQYDNDRNYFYNSQHLNASGAAIFSQQIADRLKIYLAKQPLAKPTAQASAQVIEPEQTRRN